MSEMAELGQKLDMQRQGQLTEEELKKLTPQRRADLQKSVAKYLALIERVSKKDAKTKNKQNALVK